MSEDNPTVEKLRDEMRDAEVINRAREDKKC